ncbi:MAG TPA: hypothetical protein VJC17_00765 [Candidatus Dojkabacteria bacterium]|nr:hypothetical protein [Candidatus Dojkabacteria bacterium]
MAAEAVPIYLDGSTIIHTLPDTYAGIAADYLLEGVMANRYILPGEFPKRLTIGTSITQGERVMRLLFTGQTSNALGTNQVRNPSLKRRFEIVNRLNIDKINLSPYTIYCTLEALANSIKRYKYEFDIDTDEVLDQLRRKTAFLSQFSDYEEVRYAGISADTALSILGLKESKKRFGGGEEVRKYGLNIVANRLEWLLKHSLDITRPDLQLLALTRVVLAWSDLQYLATEASSKPLDKLEFFENVRKFIFDSANALYAAELLFDLSQVDIYLEASSISPIFNFKTVVAIMDNLFHSELAEKDSTMDQIRALISQRLRLSETRAYQGKFYEFDKADIHLIGFCKKFGIELPPILRRIIEMAPQTSTEV